MTVESNGSIKPRSVECTLRVTDLANGDQTEQRLPLDCSMVLGLQAAPDGSRLMLAYEVPAGRAETRLAVVDLPGGAIRHDQLLGHNYDCSDPATECPPGVQPNQYLGMAWDDASTLRLATQEPGSRDEIDVETIPVP